MIFKAVACDYDGTIACQDRIASETVAALNRAREAGLRLVLVTGRTFFELMRVCEELDLFDAVVAENGGVLYDPATGVIENRAPPPPSPLLAELDRRGVPFQVGRVIVGTARTDERAVREVLVSCGMDLDLIYNRAALMLLPKGISKGAGVRRVIRTLGLSFHDVIALGDAENDVDFFDACGWSGCPSNAVPALKARADWVFPGENGGAISRAIVGPILNGHLPLDRSPRHRITLGWASGTAEPVAISARGVNVLIAGDPLSGKSWLAGAIVERLVERRYAVCVIDAEGDYRVLRRLPGVTWVEVREVGAVAAALAHFKRDPSACVVADLSILPHAKKLQVIANALGLIRQLRRDIGLPHWVVLDEAHYSLHGEGVPDETIGLTDKGHCLVTYRASWLRDAVVNEMDILVMSRTSARSELAVFRSRLAGLLPGVEQAVSVVSDLPHGRFLLAFVKEAEAGARGTLTFVAAPRGTPHVRHLKKYADSQVSHERSFFFRRPDGSVVATADSLNAFQQALAAVEEPVLAHHAAQGDFSRWVLDVFADRVLGSQLKKTERRWRRGEITDLRTAIQRLVAAHYGPEG